MDIDRLERIAGLLRSGALTQEEFDRLKADLIAPSQSPQKRISSGRLWPFLIAALAFIFAAAIGALLLSGATTEPKLISAETGSVIAPAANTGTIPSFPQAPIAEPADATAFTVEESRLIDEWQEANEMCRGSPDEQSIETWCPRRDEAILALNRAGICYGHEADQSSGDYQIHHCGAGSYKN